jgi:hypothetical protein
MAGGATVLAERMPGVFVRVDAKVGRQMNEAPELVRQIAGENQLGRMVVVHLGNNGPFTTPQIDELFAAIGPDRLVVLVNVFVPRRWEGEVNDALNAAVTRHPNARVADWRSLASGEAGLLAQDGYHLSPQGAQRYADLISAAAHPWPPSPP